MSFAGAQYNPPVLSSDCKLSIRGIEYIGHINTTKSGYACQPWSSQTPHAHSKTTAQGAYFADGNDSLAMNYCRDPDIWYVGPWCYTMVSSPSWEVCDVPLCSTYPSCIEKLQDFGSNILVSTVWEG